CGPDRVPGDRQAGKCTLLRQVRLCRGQRGGSPGHSQLVDAGADPARPGRTPDVKTSGSKHARRWRVQQRGRISRSFRGGETNPIRTTLTQELTGRGVNSWVKDFAFLPGARDVDTKKHRALNCSAGSGA